MDSATTERVAKLGSIFRDAAEHFEALGKLFGQMVELQVTPGSVGSGTPASPAPNSARKKKFIAERFWSTDELSKLEEGLSLFGLDVHKLKEHIGTSRPNRDIERVASCYVKADLVPKKRKRDDSPAKESNKRQKTDGADLPSVKSSQEKKNAVTASPSKKVSSTTTTPAKGKDKAKESEKKKKKYSVSSSSSSSEEDNTTKKSNNTKNNNKKSSSAEEESSSSESGGDDFD
eukprot:TRINITY_DN13324_c0_g1_i1.p1 TRINITY_DN13324_c0_g1~~TRINITY_DN13324_c0_g1_i1.p1  ORF type:complete len:232 (-),score=92.82 TRINITY_DN13324_c0_g1_i1:71-766(-)